MTHSPDNQPASAGTGSRPSLGRRIFGWSNNLLASALILLAAVVFGRQLLRWWRPAAEPPAAVENVVTIDPTLGDPTVPHALGFGSWPGEMLREPFTGDGPALLAQLRKRAVEAVARAEIPAGPPGPAEQKMLAGLADHRPVVGEPGQWAVYEMPGPIPLVAGVRFLPGQTASKPATDAPADPSPETVGPAPRVVSWGFGFPVSENQWTLFTYVLASPSASLAEFNELQLPEHTRRTMSMRAAGGGSLVGFVADAPLDDWAQQLDERLARDGWRQVSKTSPGEGRWQARFERAGQAKADGGRLDVQAVGDRLGRIRGTIFIHSQQSSIKPEQ